MGKKANRRNQTNPRKAVLAAHRVGSTDEALRQSLELRRSGAAGAHADSGVLPSVAAGRKSRMGSRAARRTAAVKDSL